MTKNRKLQTSRILTIILLLALAIIFTAIAFTADLNAKAAPTIPATSIIQDPEFYTEVLDIIGESYGYDIQPADVAGITQLTLMDNLNDRNDPRSLEGLKHFTSLEELNIGTHYLTSIDVSGMSSLKSLRCMPGVLRYGELTTISLSGCTSLERLDLRNNKLTSLDVSGLTNLEWIDCGDNKLTSINLSGCTSLLDIHCYVNELRAIDLTGLPVLKAVNVHTNNLTTINVTGLTLEYIDVRYNLFPNEAAVVGYTGTWEREPFLPQKVANNWNDVKNDMTSNAGGTVTIQADYFTNLPADVLTEAKANNVTIKIEQNDGLVISIDPASIGNITTPVPIFVGAWTSTQLQEINTVEIPADSIFLYPSLQGNFGFTMSVTIPAADISSAGINASTAKLYYVDDSAYPNDISEVGGVVANPDGSITVSFSSASYYILANIASVIEDPINVPRTGVTFNLIIWLLVLTISGAAIVVTTLALRRKKAEK